MPHFDAIVIGSGQAGPSLTGRLTDAGQTVAFIERNMPDVGREARNEFESQPAD